MPKIEVSIKEKKESDSCSVKLEVKNTDKATNNEMCTLQNVYNSVCESLKNLQK